jgi:hypothetical protein
MKKHLLFVFLMACTLCSCVLNPTYKEYEGSRIEVIRVSVSANDWKYTQLDETDQYNNHYFYAGVDMPEITADVYDNGEVKAYWVYNRQDSYNTYKQLLPYVLHKEDILESGERFFYTETVDFIYGIGWAEFSFRASDFAYEDNVNINPTGMDFDIVITYPESDK